MWRSLFLALGIFACIVGAETLAIDKAILKSTTTPPKSNNPFVMQQGPVQKELVPPAWAPWSLLSGGAITILYSFTLPKRLKKD